LFSGNRAISPIDALHLSQNKRKSEIRQKERDIQTLLYQRHQDHQSHSKEEIEGEELVLPLLDEPLAAGAEDETPQPATTESLQVETTGSSGNVTPFITKFAKIKASTDQELEALRQKGLAKKEPNRENYRPANKELKELEKLRQGASLRTLEQRQSLNDSPENNRRRPANKELKELETLRLQGLTKARSKQFTENERMSAEDKTAHDAALRDLEQRKANTSDFQFSGNGDLSPVDALYLSHNQWKKEARKKDREALGIYDSHPEYLTEEQKGGNAKQGRAAGSQVGVPNMVKQNQATSGEAKNGPSKEGVQPGPVKQGCGSACVIL
jgi:hypothetical protein